jgi:predicted dehydrogenase
MNARVAIIGCGVIGRKRAAALGGAQLIACADVDRSRAEALASAYPGVAVDDATNIFGRSDIDIVVIATMNDALAPLSVQALRSGKHVLVEKPGARSAAELAAVVDEAAQSRRLVRVGFNHRYHPALRQARRLVDEGAVGPLLFIRGRYGHGGRVGYDREWRADPVRSGGGELIDQGVHLVDLARWFLGDFPHVDGFAATYFWRMPVDDNAFVLLRNAGGHAAFLQVSCTEWKNLFSFEIYGRAGKLVIDGLGGSYGVERLTHYRMLPEMGPPETTSWEYSRGDRSWEIEFAEFLEDIQLQRQPAAGLPEARAALEIVDRIYARSGFASALINEVHGADL